jgi:hypothetical protein
MITGGSYNTPTGLNTVLAANSIISLNGALPATSSIAPGAGTPSETHIYYANTQVRYKTNISLDYLVKTGKKALNAISDFFSGSSQETKKGK